MTKQKQEFYERLAPMAMEQQIRYGVPASVTLAQAWIERGDYVNETNNYFGIHDDDGYWRKNGGKTKVFNDHGKNAHFRVYDSPAQCFEDHSRFFFRKGSRYSEAHGISTTDEKAGERWAGVLCRAGYAERKKDDPDRYERDLVREMRDYNLSAYDRQANDLAARRGVSVGYMRPSASGVAPAGQHASVGEGNSISEQRSSASGVAPAGQHASVGEDNSVSEQETVEERFRQLVEERLRNFALNDRQRSNISQASLLSKIVGSSSISEMLSYLMNGSLTPSSGGQSSGIVSTLFTGLIALAVMAKGNEDEKDDVVYADTATESEKHRSGIDADYARSVSNLNYVQESQRDNGLAQTKVQR